MNNKRPVDLALPQYHFPPMAIVSILHRISGVILFVFLPFMLYLLGHSLSSLAGFNATADLIKSPLVRLVLCAYLGATVFHFLAGLRHMMMDCGWGETPAAGRISAYTVFVVTGILIVLIGRYLWAL